MWWMTVGLLSFLIAIVLLIVLAVLALKKSPSTGKIVKPLVAFALIAIVGVSIGSASMEETISPADQRAAFDEWNKSFDGLNVQVDEAWEIAQNAINGLENGNITTVQAYSTFSNMENQLYALYKEYDDLVVPEQLDEDHQRLLAEAAKSMGTATFTKVSAMQNLQQYLDDPKPNLMAEVESMLKAGQGEMIKALGNVTMVDATLKEE